MSSEDFKRIRKTYVTMTTSFIIHVLFLGLIYTLFDCSLDPSNTTLSLSHFIAFAIALFSLVYSVYLKASINQKRALKIIKNSTRKHSDITPVTIYTKFMIVSVSIGEFPQLAGLGLLTFHTLYYRLLTLSDLYVYIGLLALALFIKGLARPKRRDFRELELAYKSTLKT